VVSFVWRLLLLDAIQTKMKFEEEEPPNPAGQLSLRPLWRSGANFDPSIPAMQVCI